MVIAKMNDFIGTETALPPAARDSSVVRRGGSEKTMNFPSRRDLMKRQQTQEDDCMASSTNPNWAKHQQPYYN
jgi:hypothetical protein